MSLSARFSGLERAWRRRRGWCRGRRHVFASWRFQRLWTRLSFSLPIPEHFEKRWLLVETCLGYHSCQSLLWEPCGVSWRPQGEYNPKNPQMIDYYRSMGVTVVYFLEVLYRKWPQFVNSSRTDCAGITSLCSVTRGSESRPLNSAKKIWVPLGFFFFPSGLTKESSSVSIPWSTMTWFAPSQMSGNTSTWCHPLNPPDCENNDLWRRKM